MFTFEDWKELASFTYCHIAPQSKKCTFIPVKGVYGTGSELRQIIVIKLYISLLVKRVTVMTRKINIHKSPAHHLSQTI